MKKSNIKFLQISIFLIVILGILYFFNYREGMYARPTGRVYTCSDSNNRDDCVNHKCKWGGVRGGRQYCS